MPPHHTKDKGDQGLGRVIADLLAAGLQVALPLSEHLPFDLIAIDRTGVEMRRLSVKYRAVSGRGEIRVEMRSSWADRHGVHTNLHTGAEFDVLAVYCPDTGRCYYVHRSEISGYGITLRPGERDLAFADPVRIFAPVARSDKAPAF